MTQLTPSDGQPACAIFLATVSFVTMRLAIRSYVPRMYPFRDIRKREAKVSAHSTALSRQISGTWLRNAFAGILATSVLVFLLILLP